LGGYLAAPFAGHMLAQLGADVVKIEPPSGDPTRTLRRGSASGTFIAYGAGKRSVALDLSMPEGRSVLLRLVVAADVVLHNLSPRATQHLGLTFEACRRANPRIVYCHIRGYGRGPRENELASNPIIEAATGVMSLNRPEGRPMRLGPSYHDMFAGTQAVVGILAALLSSEEQKAQYVEVGLYEAGLYVAARDLVTEQQNTGLDTASIPREFTSPGYGTYQTLDGRWIYLLMLADEHWTEFCAAMELREGTDPSLITRAQRRGRIAEVEQLVTEAVRRLTFEQVAARLDSVGFGYTEVRAMNDVLNDPQAREPGKLATVRYRGELFEVPNPPISQASSLGEASVELPQLGEHGRELVTSAGYTDIECDELIRIGALAVPIAVPDV
jgi:crotonobetainyl-CoA:carnitine CoA-transferase CaiB-like acyl-CoA transferase